MKKQVTIVRSAVSSLPSAGIINLLRENGFRIAGMDLTDKSAGRHLVDSFHLVSRSSESTRDKVIREIIAIAGMEKADWIISGPENEIALLASAEDQFTAMGCFLFHPVAETLRIVTDKAKLNIFLSENNFPVMPFAYKGSVIPGFGPGELVFKPSKGRGSSGVKFIRNTKEEISAVLSEAGEEEFILQPRLKGKEYTVDVLCDMSGRVTDIVPRERIAVESGISVASKTVKNESLTDLVQEFCLAVPMRGFFCIQFIEDDGAYYLTDVNPRIGGGSILSLHCSDSMRSNLVAILKNEHEKIKPSIGAYREESMFRYYQEYYV